MAEHTATGVSDSLEQSLPYVERQFQLEIQDKGGQTHVLALVAWAILSAAYSADDEASVDFLNPREPQNIVQIRFHLDAEHAVRDVFDKVQEKLDGGNDDQVPSADTPTVVQQPTDGNSGLPMTLITEKIDATVHGLIMQSEYALAIALETNTVDHEKILLEACYSDKLNELDLDLLQTRVRDLISQIDDEGDRKIRQLNLITALDRERLRTLNEPMPPTVNAFAHELIELQARLHRHNEAVCAWDGSLTYEELDRRAVRLAKNLVQRGVTLGSWVPMLFEKSKWHIVSMLAVLKAGAAFVALDVTMPSGRISNILQQLENLPLALVSDTQHEKFRGLVDQVAIFDEGLTSTDTPDVSLPRSGVENGIQYDQPAYVIFTSGSTGIPKGAVIEHRNLTTSMTALNNELAATSDMRSFQLTTLNLDFCISEIFCPLLCGGCVCIPSEWSRFNDIAGAVNSLDANFMSLSPTLLSTMSVRDFPKLKTILLAGERVWKDLTDFWGGCGIRVLHMYGPTECTVGCCFLDPDSRPHYTGLIGDPYGSKFWIVDPQDSEQLKPIGAPGEILVEGPIVGRCYLADPAKTKQTFIEPPSWFSSICQRKPIRFYKTGDLGRLTKHGDYEIVGRKDSQVKIRGWRIEVLEVEHQIRIAYGDNIGVAVEVRNPALVPGQEMLVAFLELQNYRDHEGTASIDILWEELASRETPFSTRIDQVNMRLQKFLPRYMIPSAYIPIRTFPMTNIFKLNRRKLREKANILAISDIQNATSGLQCKQTDRPLSKDEETLRGIWAEVLQIAPYTVHIEDDFFRIGGDSLKAMAAVSAARRKGMNLSVAKLYEFRNIVELTQNTSEEISEEPQDQPLSLLDAGDAPRILEMAAQQCSIDPELIQDIMPVTDMQYFYLSSQVRQPHSWMSTVAFDLPSSLDIERVKRAWEQLIALHPITRTRFVNTPLGIFQVILKSETISWRSGSSFNDLLKDLQANIRGFGFPPHTNALLISKDQTPSRLIWYANHGMLDQLMNELLSQDLAILCSNKSCSLPKRPAFKRVIQHRLHSNRKSSQAFWRSHTSGAEYKALFREDQITIGLADSKLSQDAELKVPAWLKVSEYTVAITTLALALTRVTGVDDLAFFLIRSGRVSGMPGSEDVLGPLLTRAPLRVSVKRDRRIADMLRDVDRDFEACSKHEIVCQADFASVSSEAAAHLQHGINVNFTPPASGLTLGPDALFSVDSDYRDGIDERNRIFGIFARIFRGKLTMDVVYEEQSIPRRTSRKLLDDWQAMLQLLDRVDSEMTIDRMLSA